MIIALIIVYVLICIGWIIPSIKNIKNPERWIMIIISPVLFPVLMGIWIGDKFK